MKNTGTATIYIIWGANLLNTSFSSIIYLVTSSSVTNANIVLFRQLYVNFVTKTCVLSQFIPITGHYFPAGMCYTTFAASERQVIIVTLLLVKLYKYETP